MKSIQAVEAGSEEQEGQNRFNWMIDQMSRKLEGFAQSNKDKIGREVEEAGFRKVRKEVFKQVIEQLKDTLVFCVIKAIKAVPSEKDK